MPKGKKYYKKMKEREPWVQIGNVGPLDAYRALKASEDATQKAEKYAQEHNLPNVEDNEADALRHCAWNVQMTREIDEKQAKQVADKHEELHPGKPGSRKMDEHNNKVGREIANDPVYKNLSPFEAAEKALEEGKLQTKPSKGAVDTGKTHGATKGGGGGGSGGGGSGSGSGG